MSRLLNVTVWPAFTGIVEAANCVNNAQCDCVDAFIGIVDAANCVKIAQCDCVGAFIGIVEAANCVQDCSM